MDRYPVDESGYPGTQDNISGAFDGGDTACVLGNLWFFGLMHDKEMPWHEGANVPVRHPDSSKWWGQPDRFSRDQLIGIMCGLVARGPIMEAVKLSDAHAKRYYLTAWNTKKNGVMDAPDKFPDITGPEIWALWLRIFRPWWARLVLPILDLELLVSSIHWRLFRKDRVTRNHMLSLLAARRSMPTITSWLAFKITDWDDLIKRWTDHCEAVGEYQTGHLFKLEIERIRGS